LEQQRPEFVATTTEVCSARQQRARMALMVGASDSSGERDGSNGGLR
jgi:hypothetical protein